jgi:hypothetical protein
LRYAILFSGMTERRNLNGLEFCYRSLIDCFGFHDSNIHVLTYDGSLRTTDSLVNADPTQVVWPGDKTQHRMKVTAAGSREAFVGILGLLQRQLTEDDLLFVNICGHGGNYGDGRGPFLTTFPHRRRYWVEDFCADLADLPCHQTLLVLMAQCFSGGFNRAVVAASPAKHTFIASASHRFSYAMENDLNWDSFQRNWLAALAGGDVDGSTIQHCAPTNPKRRIAVREAFDYAATCATRNPCDSPSWAARPDSASETTLREDPIAWSPDDSLPRPPLTLSAAAGCAAK